MSSAGNNEELGEEPLRNDLHGFNPEAVLNINAAGVGGQAAHTSSPTLVSNSQANYTPYGDNSASHSPAHSVGSRGNHATSQTPRERTDAQVHTSLRSRPTPASNFSALFPPPQAVASITIDHSTFPQHSDQGEPYRQPLAHPTQEASSRHSVFTSERYHPYSQSPGHSAPPSLSHSASSASHSLVSSRSSSRAVSASGLGSPYYNSRSSAPLSASTFNTPLPSFSSSGFQDWTHSSTQATASSSPGQTHRPTSASALTLPSYSSTRRGASTAVASSTPQASQSSFHAASASPYYYTFECEREESVGTGADHLNRDIEYTGKQEIHSDYPQTLPHGSSHATPLIPQTNFAAESIGSASHFGRDLTGPGKGSITGARGLLAPFTSQEHRQKSGYAIGQQNEHHPNYAITGQPAFGPSYRTTMSGNMYPADVDLDPLEPYDDDDILGNLSQGGGYDAIEEFSVIGRSASTSTNKKDEKQVRRRSSKACDQCRKSKCKCERAGDGEPCKSCMMLGTPCTFLGPSRKRGPPKGYIDAIESRLHQTEALVGILLALANPERGVLDGEDPVPDERARSLLEDLRNNDPLAREIVDRVDRGAYGTQGRKSNVNMGVDAKRSSMRPSSGSGDERSSGSGGTVKDNTKTSANGGVASMGGPPASVQGRGRMVGLGQEMEMSGLATAHPSNEWQDAVTERLKAAARSRATGGNVASAATRQPLQMPFTNNFDERERQRRRVHSPLEQQSQAERSPEQAVYPQPGHRQGSGSSGGSSDPTSALTITTSAARFSPPVAPSFTSSTYAAVGPPPSSSSSHSSYGIDSVADEVEHVEGEEGITGGVGQLSINEEAQVRFHGKASGLHLLGQRLRMDGRNKGGIWHFPKARVWPPIAPKSTMHLARVEEAEAFERASRARLPSRDVQEHLLQLYFTHVHPFLPIVHKKTFIKDFKKMHEVHGKEDALVSNAGSSDTRGRPTEPSLDVNSQGDRSTSIGSNQSGHLEGARATAGSDSARSTSTSQSSRIPTLLLLAMFAIAARYAPVAHGTTASPHQVLLEPSPTQTDTNGPQSQTKSSGPGKSAETSNASSDVASPSASKKSEEDATSDFESDATLPDPDSGHMWAAGDGFLERAKSLLDRTYASSRPSTCQALILMGYREIGIGAMAQSWLYIGMAVRMAQDLGMHRNSDSWTRDGEAIFSPIEQQIRKRIWYACVVMDKYVSAYIGRPLSIFEADYDTRLPSVEEDEELELWVPIDSMPNSILTDPVEVVSAPVPPFTPVPGRLISCFNESARLASILAMIMQAVYAVNPVSSRHFEALQLERTLDRWYMDLPEFLRFDTSVRSSTIPPPNVLILHMKYWCVVILLHRPFIPHFIAMHQKRLRPGSPVDQKAYSAAQKNFNLCVSAANHITSIVSIYQEHFCLKRCPVFLSYNIFTAAIMHMTTMATNPNDPQASLGLNKCMDVLKRIEIVWPSAARAWELLHGAKDDLPDYEPPASSTDRPKKRSADDPADTVLSEDLAHLHAARSSAATSPQAYAPTAVLGQRYDPVVEIGDSSRAFALFNTHGRWPSDASVGSVGSVGFPSGLSTSVLPQQYSAGFVDERLSAAAHRSMVSGTEGHSNGRGLSQYWSDYTIGQPASMLSSMYDLPMLSNTNHHDQQGHQTPQSLHHTQGLSGASSLYMNDQYNAFNPLPLP